MLSRIWNGCVSNEMLTDYLKYVVKTGVNDCTAAEGNLGVLILKNTINTTSRITFISFWENRQSMVKFFKSDSNHAKLYPEDKNYLLSSDDMVILSEAYLYNSRKVNKPIDLQLPHGVII